MLKPQDLVVLLKLLTLPERSAPYQWLAGELEMSPSEVHAALKRAIRSHLARKEGARIRPIVANLEEFLLHGARYAFPAEPGTVTRGVPTSYAADPLKRHFRSGNDPVPVWPDPQGTVRGVALSPLYRSVPAAARKDPEFHQLLALVDALRSGRARERELAAREIHDRFKKV